MEISKISFITCHGTLMTSFIDRELVNLKQTL
jgi:hypothetical protein